MIIGHRNYAPFVIVIICVFLLSIVGLSACAETTPTPTPPTTPTPLLVEDCSGGGIIKAKENYGLNAYGDYEIYWHSAKIRIDRMRLECCGQIS